MLLRHRCFSRESTLCLLAAAATFAGCVFGLERIFMPGLRRHKKEASGAGRENQQTGWARRSAAQFAAAILSGKPRFFSARGRGKCLPQERYAGRFAAYLKFNRR